MLYLNENNPEVPHYLANNNLERNIADVVTVSKGDKAWSSWHKNNSAT